MKYVLHTLFALILAPAVALAQADCENQPGSQPEAPIPAPQENPAGGLPMPQRTDEKRPDIDEQAPFGECDGGAVPEVRNGTFVAPRARQEQVDPGVMANVCEDMGDWKGAAQEYEREGNWKKAAENWGKLERDLARLDDRKGADQAAMKKISAEKKAAGEEARKAHEELNRLLAEQASEEEIAAARKRYDEASKRYLESMKAEREEPARREAERKAAAAKAAEDAKKAEEARRKAEADAKRAEAERKAAETKAAEEARKAEEARRRAQEEEARRQAQATAEAENRKKLEEENRRAGIEKDRKTLNLMKELGIIDVSKIGNVPGLWDWLPQLLQTPVGNLAEEVGGCAIPTDILPALGGLYKIIAAHFDPRTKAGMLATRDRLIAQGYTEQQADQAIKDMVDLMARLRAIAR